MGSLLRNSLLWVALIFVAMAREAVSADKVPISGPDLYTKKCAMCHGSQGEGSAKMAKLLKTPIRDFRQVVATSATLALWKKITLEGKGKMPAYGKKLSAREVDSVLPHLVSLTKSGKASGTGEKAPGKSKSPQ